MKKIVRLSCYLILFVTTSADAEIVTDGTTGTVQSLSDQMIIPQSLGTTVGNNLFHSFQTFNINTGESATFTGSDTLHNVISRVTGGQVSTIDGLLKSEIPNANFYFINPAGVTFGANAQVDVPAAFHVSTANYLKFADGSQFSATNSTANTLTIAEPQSFGFLGNQTGTIEILGSQLQLKAGRATSFSSGNLTINNSQLLNTPYMEVVKETGCDESGCWENFYGTMILTGNDLRLYAVGNSQAEILFNQNQLQPLSGPLHINHSVLDTTGFGAGYLSLNAGDIQVTDYSQLLANNSGVFNAEADKGINILADNLQVTDSQIMANTEYTDGANLEIKANTLTLTGKDSRIGGVNTSSFGKGGDVTIEAQQIKILNGSRITTEMHAPNLDAVLNSSAVGNGGNIHIKTHALTLDGEQSTDRYSAITSMVWPMTLVSWISNLSHGGNVTIETDSLELLNLADISSTTLSRGVIGGDIDITTKALKMDGKFAGIHAGSIGGGENSGNINLVTNTLEILHGAAIVADSTSTSSAGNINITADSVKINGLAEDNAVTGITADSFGFLNGNSGLHPTLLETGNEPQSLFVSDLNLGSGSGTINITTRTLQMENGGIISSALLDGTGSPGSILVSATEQIQLASHSKISNRTEAPLGLNTSYFYDYDTGEFNFLGGFSGFWGQPAGKVMLNSPDIGLDNSSINSNTTNFINAGDISVQATNITLVNGSTISSASSNSYGDAGKINLNADNALLLEQSSINTASTGNGRGGDIQITTNNLSLDNHSSISATSKSVAPSGNISLIAADIGILNNSLVSAANSGAGAAGAIEIRQNNLLTIKDNSAINTSFSTVDNNTPATTYLNLNTGLPWTKEELFAAYDWQEKPILLAVAKQVTNFYNTGDAGAVRIDTKTLDILNSSRIHSETDAQGSAGNISVIASDVLLDNAEISAAATHNSSGQTGEVKVIASKSLQLANHATISIKNDAKTTSDSQTIKAGFIKITAPDIDLKNSAITAESTGNINASPIEVNFSHALTMDPSFITTSANSGNGGVITITGSGLIHLQNSGFLTSVKTASGNGGNINVAANTLIMDNGVIQANAVGGNGGEINLQLQTLIPSQNQLIKGGLQVVWQPFVSGFNLIQAASANGVNGSVNVSSPQFNISGSISGLDSAALVMPIIDQAVCQGSTLPASSLVNRGKGGIPDDGLQFSFVPTLSTQNVLQQTQDIITINGINIKQKSLPCVALSI